MREARKELVCQRAETLLGGQLLSRALRFRWGGSKQACGALGQQVRQRFSGRQLGHLGDVIATNGAKSPVHRLGEATDHIKNAGMSGCKTVPGFLEITMRILACLLVLVLAAPILADEPNVYRGIPYAEPKNERQML